MTEQSSTRIVGYRIATIVVAIVALLTFPFWILDGILTPLGVVRLSAHHDFADFVNGIASPLIQLFLLYYVMRTYNAQKEELRLVQEQLTLQTAEMKKSSDTAQQQLASSSAMQLQTFVLTLFDELRTIVSDMEYVVAGTRSTGHVAIRKFRDELSQTLSASDMGSFDERLKRVEDRITLPTHTFGRFWDFVFWSLSVLSDAKKAGLSEDVIRSYVGLYKAVLTQEERHLLLIYALTNRGVRLKPLLIEFEILTDVDLFFIPSDIIRQAGDLIYVSRNRKT